MPVMAIKCPGCGASITPNEGASTHTCTYCGTVVQLQGSSKGRSRGGTSGTTPPPSGKAAILMSLISLAIFVAIGAGVYLMTSSHAEQLTQTLKDVSSKVPTVAGVGNRELWDDVGGRPLFFSADKTPAFVGRVRRIGEDQLFFAAFSQRDGKELYRLGPFGTYSDGYRHTFAAIAGDRLAISDHRAKLHLFDANTGEAAQVVELQDRVELLCGTSGDTPTFWIQRVDREGFTVDAKDGTLSPAKRPEGCLGASRDEIPFGRLIPSQDERKALKKIARDLDGIEPTALADDGERTLVAGHRSPGTKVPIAAAIAKDGAVLWRQEVPTVDPFTVREESNSALAVAGGRYFTIYGPGNKAWHVTAFDTASGDRLWDQRLRTIFAVDKIDGLFASENALLVVRTSSLEVLDPTTGELRATIGSESYER